MTYSHNMAGKRSCRAQMFIQRYFEAIWPVVLYLSACFKVSFPEYHAKYKAAFEARAWISEDPGPWLGRAIV